MKSLDEADVRPHLAHPAQLLLVLEHRVTRASSSDKHAVGAALYRQVQVVRELGYVAERLDQAVAELDAGARS